MTYTEQAVRIACEHNWKNADNFSSGFVNGTWRIIKGNKEVEALTLEQTLLDPLFFQALGRGLGWTPQGGTGREYHDEYNEGGYPSMYDWQIKWHRFIDHLAAEKDTEIYFKNLLEK